MSKYRRVKSSLAMKRKILILFITESMTYQLTQVLLNHFDPSKIRTKYYIKYKFIYRLHGPYACHFPFSNDSPKFHRIPSPVQEIRLGI